jgi:hypothetical protein
LPAFAKLSRHAERIFDEIAAQAAAATVDEVPITIADVTDIVVDCLATNYRVEKEECSLLGVLTTRANSDALKALVDLPAYVAAYQKKTGEASSSGALDE